MNENDKISIPFVMVGSENRPASQQDIDDMKNAIQNVLNGTASAVITHHNI